MKTFDLMKKIKLQDNQLLNDLYNRCREYLCSASDVTLFLYPEQLVKRKFRGSDWDGYINDIKDLNDEKILSNLRNKVTNYAVYTGKNGDWKLRYIGQTLGVYARARLTNHLITKGNGTGAKLDLVKQAVKEGLDIGIKLLEVEPEGLRHYIEERIINDSDNHPDNQPLDWNKHLKKLPK